MRTLFEIIEAVKDGERPEYDELRYALLVTDFMLTDISQFVLMDLYGKGKLEGWDKKKYEMKDEQRRKALNTDPKIYIGNFDPDAPGRQRERELHKKLFEKIMKDAKPVSAEDDSHEKDRQGC